MRRYEDPAIVLHGIASGNATGQLLTAAVGDWRGLASGMSGRESVARQLLPLLLQVVVEALQALL